MATENTASFVSGAVVALRTMALDDERLKVACRVVADAAYPDKGTEESHVNLAEVIYRRVTGDW